jgi:hypothetical protein
MQKVGAVRRESLARVQSVLTAPQKQAWQKLTGTPFELRFEFRRPEGKPPGEKDKDKSKVGARS